MTHRRHELEGKRRTWSVLIALDFIFIAVCASALSLRAWSHLTGSQGAEKAPPAAQAPAQAESPPPQKAAPTPPKIVRKSGRRRAAPVTFRYRAPSAGKVEMTASFFKWKRKPLRRQGDLWSITAYMFPGTYKYRFIVDGKEIPDPSNPLKEGEDSLLVVPD